MSEIIHQISEDENSRLIISTIKKLYYFEDEKLIPLPSEKQRVPRTSYSRIPGSEWVIEADKITHRKNGTETIFLLDQVFPGINTYPEGIALYGFEDSRGGLWFGGSSNLYYLSENSSKSFTSADIFGSAKPGYFVPILEDEKGNIWLSFNANHPISAKSEMVKYDGEKFERGYVDDVLVSGIIDRENNLWFTTIGSGLKRLQKRTITNLSVKDGLAGNEVYPIIQTRSGDIYIGTTFGVNLYRNGKLSFLKDLKNRVNMPFYRAVFRKATAENFTSATTADSGGSKTICR